jgi:hypothetical protein
MESEGLLSLDMGALHGEVMIVLLVFEVCFRDRWDGYSSKAIVLNND